MNLSIWAIVLIPFGLGILLLGFITLNRYIAYKERVALAQLGFSLEALSRDAAAKTRGNRGVLWGGVITATSGLALLMGLGTLGVGVWLLVGLLPLFVGLGMVLIYFLTMGAAPPTEDAGSAEEKPFAADEEKAESPELDSGPDTPGS